MKPWKYFKGKCISQKRSMKPWKYFKGKWSLKGQWSLENILMENGSLKKGQRSLENVLKDKLSLPSLAPPCPAPDHHLHHQRARHHHQHLLFCQVLLRWYFNYGDEFIIMASSRYSAVMSRAALPSPKIWPVFEGVQKCMDWHW